MMKLLCWRNTGCLQEVTDNVVVYPRFTQEIAENAVREVYPGISKDLLPIQEGYHWGVCRT
jgi:uncharacterized protein YihD (DUF1040 family)